MPALTGVVVINLLRLSFFPTNPTAVSRFPSQKEYIGIIEVGIFIDNQVQTERVNALLKFGMPSGNSVEAKLTSKYSFKVQNPTIAIIKIIQNNIDPQLSFEYRVDFSKAPANFPWNLSLESPSRIPGFTGSLDLRIDYIPTPDNFPDTFSTKPAQSNGPHIATTSSTFDTATSIVKLATSSTSERVMAGTEPGTKTAVAQNLVGTSASLLNKNLAKII